MLTSDGLIFGGLIFGGAFLLRSWVAYIGGGLYSEGYGIVFAPSARIRCISLSISHSFPTPQVDMSAFHWFQINFYRQQHIFYYFTFQ